MAASKKTAGKSKSPLMRAFDFLTSLRLTIALLALAAVLVYWGTLAQVRFGLWEAQRIYFRSLLVMWGPEGADWRAPVFPGGYLIGGVLLANLIAAHARRFKLTRKKIGIFLTHIGLIMLLLGQLFTELLQVETQIRLEEGASGIYTESPRETELVFIDTSGADSNKVVSVADASLREGKGFKHPELPFRVRLIARFANSHLDEGGADHGHDTATSLAAQTQLSVTDMGARLNIFPSPVTYGMEERNLPSALVEILDENGESLGAWVVSSWFIRNQEVVVGDKTYEIALRFRRHYKEHRIHLIDFRHDKYEGTEVPKNFSSLVQVEPLDGGEPFKKKIYMNHPMRYGGETYYQASFDRANPRITVLQVVRNPSWLTPYVSCTIVGLGLVIQFMMSLSRFLKRNQNAQKS